MKHTRSIAALIAAASLLIFPLSAAATEAVTGTAEPDTVAETVYETTAESIEETVAETNAAVTVTAEGIYRAGVQWAKDNPEIFASLLIASVLMIVGVLQFIAYIRVKKPVVTSSNNAVEVYTSAEERIRQNNTETEARMAEILQKAEAMTEVIARMAEEGKRYREAVELLSEVVGRLMEESSLPDRIRKDIHKLVAKADDMIRREEHDHEDQSETRDL